MFRKSALILLLIFIFLAGCAVKKESKIIDAKEEFRVLSKKSEGVSYSAIYDYVLSFDLRRVLSPLRIFKQGNFSRTETEGVSKGVKLSIVNIINNDGAFVCGKNNESIGFKCVQVGTKDAFLKDAKSESETVFNNTIVAKIGKKKVNEFDSECFELKLIREDKEIKTTQCFSSSGMLVYSTWTKPEGNIKEELTLKSFNPKVDEKLFELPGVLGKLE